MKKIKTGEITKKITTIKLTKETKSRLDKLKLYPKESYENALKRMLSLLNSCRIEPQKAQKKLIRFEKLRRVYYLRKE